MIPEELIAAVRSQTDIVELTGSYLPLRKAGQSYKTKCPFHKEATASFSVSPEKQIFKCFGCGIHGGVIEFLQKIERKNFPEAVNSLALRAGLLEAEISGKKGTVYVLMLQQDKYYIGFTRNFDKRLEAHQTGKGAAWTKTYPVIKVLERFDDVPFEMENEISQKYMSQYGWQNVRGGDYIFSQLTYQQTPEALHRKKKDGTYLLQLEQNKYYIGYAQDMDADILRQFQGTGAAWTKQHQPKNILKKIKSLNIETAKTLTLQAMKDYGWENVRGYRWDQPIIQRPKELDE